MSPVPGAMAVVALTSVTAGMLIVVLVAVITSGTQLDAIELARMAGITMDGGMGASQLEVRVLVMIEDQLFPFLFVMTLLAFVAIASRVNVIDTVASHTFFRQVLIALIGMAAIACGFLVFAV